ncbi:MAG: OmpA family protein [bacterium]
MRPKLWILSGVLILGHLSVATAQVSKARLGAGLLVGGSKIQGDIENSSAALTGGVLLTYSSSPNFALSATATYTKMTSGLNAINTRVFSTALAANFYIWPTSVLKPFVSLGLSGFHYETTTGTDAPLFRPDGSRYMGWESAVQLGIGFQLSASKQWAVNTMGNYNITQVDDLDAINGGRNDGFFKGLVGLVRYFKNGDSWQEEDRYEQSWREIEKDLAVEQVQQTSTPTRSQNTERPPVAKPSFSGGIQFEPGSARLLDSSKAQLDKIYQFLVTNPGEEIELLGKSTRSQQSVNYRLVVERARSIKAYLVSKGISPRRIIIHQNGD